MEFPRARRNPWKDCRCRHDRCRAKPLSPCGSWYVSPASVCPESWHPANRRTLPCALIYCHHAGIRLAIAFTATSLLLLDLNRSAVLVGRTRSDHEIATLDFVLTAHDLADWSDRVDDGRASRICHEALQGLEDAGTSWLIGKCKHVRIPRFKSGDGRLQHLHQPLVGQRDAGGCFSAFNFALLCGHQPQLR